MPYHKHDSPHSALAQARRQIESEPQSDAEKLFGERHACDAVATYRRTRAAAEIEIFELEAKRAPKHRAPRGTGNIPRLSAIEFQPNPRGKRRAQIMRILQ